MSLLLEHIENHPKETKRLIGIDYEQLQQLFTQASAIHHQRQAEKEISKFQIALELDVNLNFPWMTKYFNFSLSIAASYLLQSAFNLELVNLQLIIFFTIG